MSDCRWCAAGKHTKLVIAVCGWQLAQKEDTQRIWAHRQAHKRDGHTDRHTNDMSTQTGNKQEGHTDRHTNEMAQRQAYKRYGHTDRHTNDMGTQTGTQTRWAHRQATNKKGTQTGTQTRWAYRKAHKRDGQTSIMQSSGKIDKQADKQEYRNAQADRQTGI